MPEIEKIPGIVAIFYDAVAARGFMRLYQEIAEEIVTEVKSGKILDIGTGPGSLPIEIAKLNSQLEMTGIDLSRRMVDLAHKNAETAKIDRARFEVADVHDLPYQNNSFDFVLSTLSFHHWRDIAKGLSECSRVVRNGGLVWIYDIRKDATRKEIKRTIGGNGAVVSPTKRGKKIDAFRRFYLSFGLPFHGLKTEEYFSGEIREAIEKNGFSSFEIEKKNAMICIKLRKLSNANRESG